MAVRLVELYPMDTPVEITFGGDDWLSAIIIAHAHPGVWVQTTDGLHWFVTHRDRIRRMVDPPEQTEGESHG
jgi:hypothetical protein